MSVNTELRNTIAEVLNASLKTAGEQWLKSAAENSKTIVSSVVSSTKSKLTDQFQEEIYSRKDEEIKWKNNLNKDHFDFADQMNRVMARAEIAYSEKRYERVAELIKEGKSKSKQRKKIIRLADRDGWEVAFAYMSDDLAEDESDRKLMSKAKKAVANEKSDKKDSQSQAAKGRQGGSSSGYNQSRDKSRRGDADHGSSSGYTTGYATGRKRPFPGRRCFNCNKHGHIAEECRQSKRR